MSIPFSRSMRSLKMDTFRISVSGIIIVLTVLIAWMAWFFLAPISMYEITKEAKILEDGKIVANFPISTKGKITTGQNVNLHLHIPSTSSKNEKQEVISHAMVMKVVPAAENEKNQMVEMNAMDDVFYTIFAQIKTFPATLDGQVDVEIEQVTPFMLVQRASKQQLTAPQVPPPAELGPRD